MDETPNNESKEITIRFAKLSKWLWKTKNLIWGTILVIALGLITGVIGNLFISSTPFNGTALDWLLHHPIVVFVIIGGLLLLNAVIYFGSRLEIDPSAKDIKRIYLKRMIRETEALVLTGVPAGLVATSVPLDEVFIPVQFRRNRPLTDYPLTDEELQQLENRVKNAPATNEDQAVLLEAENSWQHKPEETDNSNINDLWQQLTIEHPVAVIQGYPGMGKTTLLNRLTLYMARRSLGQPDSMMSDNLEPPLIPIFVRLRDYAEEYKRTASDCSLLNYFRSMMKRLDIPGLDSFLMKELSAGRCLIMLDGLDEINDLDTKRRVEEAIKAFITDYSSSNGISNFNRVLITSRVAGYDQSTFHEYPHYTITELTAKQCEDFLMRWSRANARRSLVQQEEGMLTETTAKMVKSFTAALAGNPSVRELTKNPLLLTLLALLQQKSEVLPRARVDLCTLATRTLLENRNVAKNLPPIPESQAVHRLGLIAFKMQESGNSLNHYKEVLNLLTQSIASEGGTPDQVRQEAEEFLNRIRERGGIFVLRSRDHFGFTHRIFQEYFAARYFLVELRQDPDHWLPELIKRVHRLDDLWREPFLLAVAYSSDENEMLSNQIIQRLLDTSPTNNRTGQEHDLLLAIECLVEARPYTIQQTLETRIAERLLYFYQWAQQNKRALTCKDLEDAMRRWLENLPEEGFRPALLKVLQEAFNDKQNLEHRNATLSLLSAIGWTKLLESLKRENESTVTN